MPGEIAVSSFWERSLKMSESSRTGAWTYNVVRLVRSTNDWKESKVIWLLARYLEVSNHYKRDQSRRKDKKCEYTYRDSRLLRPLNATEEMDVSPQESSLREWRDCDWQNAFVDILVRAKFCVMDLEWANRGKNWHWLLTKTQYCQAHKGNLVEVLWKFHPTWL